MKKIILFILFSMSAFFVFAQKNSYWADTASGDYVIYRDYSWKEPTWVGILYYNKNTLGSFLYTSGGKVFAKILFTGEEDSKGKFVATGQNIISGINTDPNYTYAVNYLMDLLPKLYEWRTVPQTDSLIIKKASKFVNEEQFGGNNEIKFYSYIPLFYLKEILDKGKKAVFELEEIGYAKEEKIFFDFTPKKISKQKLSKFKLKRNPAKETKTVNGINLFLDSHWKQIADNSFLMGNEAFLTVNTVNLNQAGNIKDCESFLIKYFCSSGKDAKILADKTDISGSKDKFKIMNHVYDFATASIKYDIKTVIKKENKVYNIISLTIDKAVYEKYKKYFDNLF